MDLIAASMAASSKPSSLTALTLFSAGAAVTAAAAFYLSKRNRLSRGIPQPVPTASVSELRRMLAVIEHEILPKTTAQVAAGDKVFGAAILDTSYKTVMANTKP